MFRVQLLGLNKLWVFRYDEKHFIEITYDSTDPNAVSDYKTIHEYIKKNMADLDKLVDIKVNILSIIFNQC